MDSERKKLREEIAKEVFEEYCAKENITHYPLEANLYMTDWYEVMSLYVDRVNREELAQARPEISQAVAKIAKFVEDEQFMRGLAGINDPKFVIVKAAEECSELNKVLLQHLTKPDQILREDIIKEIADVEIQFMTLKALLNCDEEVKSYIPVKIAKLRSYKETIPNFGKLAK